MRLIRTLETGPDSPAARACTMWGLPVWDIPENGDVWVTQKGEEVTLTYSVFPRGEAVCFPDLLESKTVSKELFERGMELL